MNIKNSVIFLCATVLALSLIFLNRHKPTRETIFDRIVSIPKELVLDIPYLSPLCDEIKGLKKGFVDINHGRLYYEEEGHGIPLLLINGGPGGTHHVFHPYFSQLKDMARIIYYDQRGTGKSSIDETGKTYTIKQAVEDLESLRKALKIDKWAVLGWSYGGFLAQCYALAYPEHATELILVAAELGFSESIMKPRKQMFISSAEEDAIINIRQKYREGEITPAQSMYNQHLAGDWKRYNYYRPTREELIRKAFYEWSPAQGFAELMRSEIDKINLKGKFDDFEIPTLIMEAQWDLLCWYNPDKAEFMRKNHPHAQFEYFEKSGHGIFMDEPEKFFKIVRAFLEKVNKTIYS